jgi:hypothetical protein
MPSAAARVTTAAEGLKRRFCLCAEASASRSIPAVLAEEPDQYQVS